MADRFPRLYLVTDLQATLGRPLLEVLADALNGGVDAVQLRAKDFSGHDLVALGAQIRTLCDRHNARLLVNDRIDIALAVRADGVHLPANSFSPADARRLLGPDAWIGVSTHTPAEARAACAAGADFIVFGPVFDTPSKRAFGRPLGLDALGSVTCVGATPVVAIGGITAAHVPVLREHGARGVAVISAILAAADPRDAAHALITAWKQGGKQS